MRKLPRMSQVDDQGKQDLSGGAVDWPTGHHQESAEADDSPMWARVSPWRQINGEVPGIATGATGSLPNSNFSGLRHSLESFSAQSYSTSCPV
jgi:hypothetical protein